MTPQEKLALLHETADAVNATAELSADDALHHSDADALDVDAWLEHALGFTAMLEGDAAGLCLLAAAVAMPGAAPEVVTALKEAVEYVG
jgi:hypothetical protein